MSTNHSWGKLKRALLIRHPSAVRGQFARDAFSAALLPREPLVRLDRGDQSGAPDPSADAASSPLREVAAGHPQGMFLTGEPGYGKGAALRWLQNSIAGAALEGGGYHRAEIKVPVYVVLDRLPNSDLDSAHGVLLAITRTLLRTSGLPESDASLEVLSFVAKQYGLTVLLDGLNRIVARSTALVSVEEAMRFLQAIPNVQLVVCSRADVGNATALPEYRLIGLETREQSIAFLADQAAVRGRAAAEAPSRYQRMVKLGMTKDQLSNPFMMWLADQTLDSLVAPVTRTSIYSAYRELIWRDAYKLDEQTRFSLVNARGVLATHCYHTLLSRHDLACEQLGVGDWESWMDEHGGHDVAERILDTLAYRTNLVLRTGIRENPYTLFHPTFVEYYAAEFLTTVLGGDFSAEKLQTYLRHPSFDNTLMFLAGVVAPGDREALLDSLLEWDVELAARAVAEWRGSGLAARLPRDGRLLVRAGAWEEAGTWLAEQPEAESAHGVASTLAHHHETRLGALAWFEAHTQVTPAHEVAREFVRHEETRASALSWLWQHPEDEWAWEAVLELVAGQTGRREALDWFASNAQNRWAGRVGAALARFDDTRAAVREWLGINPEAPEAARVARELACFDDTRDAVVQWLAANPKTDGAGRVAREIARAADTRWAARQWLEAVPCAEWAGRVASELAGYADGSTAALAWLKSAHDPEWVGLVAWKLTQDDHLRRALVVRLHEGLADEAAGAIAAELADCDDTRGIARDWLCKRPEAPEAGRVARHLAAYPESREAAREWMERHPHNEWASFVARKLAACPDTRQAVLEWLERNSYVIGTGTVASELAGHMDTRQAVLGMLEEHADTPWAATVLAQQYDVRVDGK